MVACHFSSHLCSVFRFYSRESETNEAFSKIRGRPRRFFIPAVLYFSQKLNQQEWERVGTLTFLYQGFHLGVCISSITTEQLLPCCHPHPFDLRCERTCRFTRPCLISPRVLWTLMRWASDGFEVLLVFHRNWFHMSGGPNCVSRFPNWIK